MNQKNDNNPGLTLNKMMTNVSGLSEEKPSKKKPVWCIAGVLVIVLVIIIVCAISHAVAKDDEAGVEHITTPSGVEEIPSKKLEAFFDAVDERDLDAMNELLDEYPFLIYEQGVLYPELDDVILRGTPEMVQAMLDHGAVIDDRFLYEPRVFAEYTYQYSLENYLNRYYKSDVEGEALIMVRFLIDNGAKTVYEYDDIGWEITNVYGDKIVGYHQPNALFSVVDQICKNKELTEEDAELIKLILDTGIDTKVKNHDGETAAEYFRKNVESNDIPMESDSIAKMLN